MDTCCKASRPDPIAGDAIADKDVALASRREAIGLMLDDLAGTLRLLSFVPSNSREALRRHGLALLHVLARSIDVDRGPPVAVELTSLFDQAGEILSGPRATRSTYAALERAIAALCAAWHRLP